MSFTIRKMTYEEVGEIAIKWAAAEGWNPGLHDAACFYQTDSNGFFVGLLNNEPIACISAVSYHKTFGFIGFYIVKPSFRGMGYGLQIWNHAISYLKSHNIGLDGVIEQQDNYRKSGFKLAYSNIRFEFKTIGLKGDYDNIKIFNDSLLDELLQYDEKLFPVNRFLFLKNWVNLIDSKTYIALQNGRITGYICIRKCFKGYKIGPLFADNSDIAEKLLLTSQSDIEKNSLVFLDIPEINEYATKLAEKYDMLKVFGTARMYTGEKPDINTDKIFGVTTFELG